MKPKNITMRAFVAALTLSGSMITGMNAAIVAEFDYAAPSSATTLSPSSVMPGVTVTPLTLTNPANTASAFDNHFYHNNWSPTVDPGKFYETAIINNTGGELNLSCMNFSMENTSGISTWTLRAFTDGFTNDIATGTFSDGIVTDFVHVDTSSIPTLQPGDIVPLRWYVTTESAGVSAGFANHHPGGAGGGLPDVGIDLTIHDTCVPEPSSTLLIGIGGMGLILRRKRS